MRPTIENIAEAIKQEGTRHGLVEGSLRVDITPAIEVPGRNMGFEHEIDFRCGYRFLLRTQHSGKTQAGGIEFHQCLAVEMSEHGVTACATMIHELHEPKQ